MENKNNYDDFSETLRIDPERKRIKMKSKRKWIYLIPIVIVLIVLIALAHSSPNPEIVYVMHERSGSAVQPILRNSGYVTYPQEIEIGTTLQGPVKKITFKEGQQVKQGAILAELENSELMVQKELQIKRVHNAEENYKRIQKLHAVGSVSDAQLEAATIEWEDAHLTLQQLNKQIELTRIKAPVTGRIVENLIEVGELVNGSVAKMIDNSETLVEVDINQNDVAKIRYDQPALTTLDAYPSTEYAAKIWQIAPFANRAKNTVRVKLKILYPDERFKPGLSAKVYFVKEVQAQNHEIRTSLTVPKTAILNNNGVDQVWQVKNNTLKLQKVKVGEDLGEKIEILSGLDAEDKIINHPDKYNLEEGQNINNSSFGNWLHH